MKTKNVAQLKSLLERSGMALDEEGKVSHRPAPATVLPTQAAVDSTNEKILEALREVVASARETARAAGKPVQPAEARPLKWKFTIERDQDGFMSVVHAEAAE